MLILVLLDRIKEDDILIQAEGVESLSESELRQACRERGYLGLLSIGDMRQQVFFKFCYQFVQYDNIGVFLVVYLFSIPNNLMWG